MVGFRVEGSGNSGMVGFRVEGSGNSGMEGLRVEGSGNSVMVWYAPAQRSFPHWSGQQHREWSFVVLKT
jgi:hypothetical protein